MVCPIFSMKKWDAAGFDVGGDALPGGRGLGRRILDGRKSDTPIRCDQDGLRAVLATGNDVRGGCGVSGGLGVVSPPRPVLVLSIDGDRIPAVPGVSAVPGKYTSAPSVFQKCNC